jgi:adenine-specific DNA-methyltransferase
VGWIAAWAKAFDKEPLTKDFFRRFDNALDRIKADLQKYQHISSAEAYTQSQLPLERLIFLYFLQNRGWLNQDRRYLPSRLGEYANKPDGFAYYQDFLEKLFWTLSTAPGGAGRLPGIPFLNGGLFDDDEFLQPANLRKTTPPLKVRNQSMQYVFQELLEAFNFTVSEDTPLNQEVAVDPEMLGKVFESIVLHAEAADPDATAPDKRKATGSYYTPRIVVHFICQEVLYQYLLSRLPGDGWGARLKALFSIDPTEGIDEEVKLFLKKTISPEQSVQIRALVLPLKCCDPAVGSGAFPVGLMHELVNLRRLLETAANGYKDPVVSQGSQWLHEAKEQIVENCLFGVDIQQQAIEICRLRLWLTLIVDYDLGLDPFTAEKNQFSRAIEHISQLPNLEMNFRRGDSLHDHISGVPVVILPQRASRHASEFAAISRLGAELHNAKKAERKKKLRLDILEKRLHLSRKIPRRGTERHTHPRLVLGQPFWDRRLKCEET